MAPERIHELKAAFDAALEAGPTDRQRVVERSCRGDPQMIREVMALLRRHDDGPEADGAEDADGSVRRGATTPAEPAGGKDGADAPRAAATRTDPVGDARPVQIDAGPDAFDLERLMIGRRVGCYVIKQRLADGGMSVVFEAEQESPRRAVAFKMLRRHLLQPESVERFRFEAEVLGQLRHSAIARVHEAGTFELQGIDWPYLVMELVTGASSITEYAGQRGLSVRERVALMKPVCEAIAEAHDEAVIHRDLKPGNILVDAYGKPKVIDFGVARSLRFRDSMGMTTLGQRIGTPQYMSPEQFRGDPAAVDRRSDIYGLGCVLYELLADRPALDLSACESLDDASRVVHRAERTPLTRLNRQVDAGLSRIVLTAMHPDSQHRYRTAGDLAEDLDRWLRDLAPLGGGVGVRERLLAQARRHRALLVVLCLGVLVLAGTTAAGFTFAARSRQMVEQLERAAAELEATQAETAAVARFFSDALSVRGRSVVPQPDLPVHELLRLQLESARVDEALPPMAVVKLLEEIARMFRQEGEPARAVQLLKDAYDILRDEGGDAARQYEIRLQLAYASKRAGRHAEAIQHFDALTEEVRSREPSEPELLASLIIQRADTIRRAGGDAARVEAGLAEALGVAAGVEAADPRAAARIRAEVEAARSDGP